MKVLDLVQGSDQWLEARLNYLCASEAPAMMGDSKFMSRNQLLDLKKGWKSNPDSSFKKRLYEKGHEHEEQAREITEMEYCEEFPATVGLTQVYGISVELLSSFDGYSSIGAWEHKDWNLTLAENVRNAVLEPLYYWQLEHQMLTAGHSKIMFTCSDGTQDNRVSMIYESVPERREQLIAGWKQFLSDLDKHEIKAKQETVIAVQTSLPVITFNVTGTEIATNIGDCLEHVKELAQAEMSKVLETDQDFANKDQLNKDVKKARSALKEIVGKVRGEFVSYSQFEEVAQEMDGVLQKMQSHGEKQVKQAKEAKKQAILDDAARDLELHFVECNAKISPMYVQNIINVQPDWTGAMKNKRTIESLTNAVNEELAKWKVEINQVIDRVVPNLQYLRDNAEEYKFLFSDAQQLVNQYPEPFQAIVKSRIADHKQAEEERLEAERQRIEREAKEKAEREAEAKAEAERERIRQEERAKAQAEEQAKREAEKAAQPEPEPERKAEADKVFEDAVSTGTGFSQGGKRVAPEDVYQEPEDKRVEIVISCYESQRSEIISLLMDQLPVEVESESRVVMQ